MPGRSRGRGRPPHPSLLTPAEQRALEELRRGGTNAEIAVRLGLSPETVKTHIASMLSKLDVGDRRELAAWQPQEESARQRILGVLGVPSKLFLLKRPLVWAGAGLAGATGITVAAIFIAAMLASGDQSTAVPPDHDPTAEAAPSPSTTPPPTTTPQPTPPPTLPEPDLIVVSDGSHDSLLLEWVGGPENATRWQYRLRRWENAQPLEWEAWTDVPGSVAVTRGYRVTGLQEDTAYGFQVRGVVGPPGVAEAYGVSPASETGATTSVGRPVLQADRLAQGDGVTEWVIADFAIIVPAGLRVTTAAAETSGGGELTVPVFEAASGSVLRFTPSGELVEWEVFSPLSVEFRRNYFRHRLGALGLVTPLSANVNTLFEQIVASVRPLAPTAATPESAARTLPAPALLVFSDGSTDALSVEWQDRSEGVTGWQYRARTWEDGASSEWGDWTEIPSTAAAARRYRVTGLHDNTAYEFEVRPLRGAAPGAAIQAREVLSGSRDVGWGITNSRGRLPYLHQRTVAEGDGSTEWRPFGDFLVTIPAGMQVLGGAGRSDWGLFSTLTDVATGSALVFTYSGEEWSRTIRAPRVNALFDQIVASLRGCGPVCASPPQTLLAFSDGAPDSLLLEWGRADRGLSRREWSTPEGLTGWQYRVRPYRLSPGGWSEWTDFPESTGASRRGRVSGLRPDTVSQFEVRAVVGALAGDTSARTRGLTQLATGLPIIHQGYAVEGDGRTEWRVPGGQIVVTIPAGMLVEEDGHARGGLRDLNSSSWLLINLGTGSEERREVRNTVQGGRDVDALFDQIVASAWVVGSTATSTEPVSGASAPTPVQRVGAALATLTACMQNISSAAEKSDCVNAYADTLDAIEEGDGAQPTRVVVGDGVTQHHLPAALGGAFAIIIPDGASVGISEPWCLPWVACHGAAGYFWVLTTVVHLHSGSMLVLVLDQGYSTEQGSGVTADGLGGTYEFMRIVYPYQGDLDYAREVERLFDAILASLVRVAEGGF